MSDIDPGLCTHVIYAFAVLDSTSLGLKAHDSYLDLDDGLGNFRKFISDLRGRNPSVKLLLAVGGWTDSQDNKAAYKKMLSSRNNRYKIRLEVVTKLNGSDISCLFPLLLYLAPLSS